MYLPLLLISCYTAEPNCPPQDKDCSTIELQSGTDIISCTVADEIKCVGRDRFVPWIHHRISCSNTRTPICKEY